MNLLVVRAIITLLLGWGGGSGVHAYCSVRAVDRVECVNEVVCQGEVEEPPLPALQCTSGDRLARIRLQLCDPYASSNPSCNVFLERVLWLRATDTHYGAFLSYLFNCTPNLQFLQLPDNNYYSELPYDMFYNLKALRSIDLSGNSITEVPVDAFVNNENLESIFLSHNNITQVHSFTFSSQKHLEYLDLSYNIITTLQKDSFNGLDNIKVLRLNNNKLVALNGSLKRLVSLQHIYLRDNRLYHVHVNEIPNILRLQTLDLAGNGLSSIQPEVFSRPVYLTPAEKKSAQQSRPDYLRNQKPTSKIILSNNKISILKNATSPSCGITSQATREEVRNTDSIIPEGILPTEIDLSHNVLKTIEFEAFSGIVIITFLDLSSNKLQSFDINTTTLQYLEHLLLKNNHIRTLNATTFSNLSKLVELDVSENKIESFVNNSNWAPRNLRSLELSFNSLQVLDSAALGPLAALTELKVTNNRLAAVRLDGCDVPDLRRLSLRANHLTDLCAVRLLRLLQLSTLDLAHNRLTAVPAAAFAHLSALRHLDLGYNNISILNAGAFMELNSLITLDLSNNDLTSINFGTFTGVERLEQLNLSGNRLNIFDSRVLFDMQALRRVNLEDNHLIELDASVWMGRDGSVRVEVAGNCLHCAAVERALVDAWLGLSSARLVGREGWRGDVPSVGGVPCVAPPPASTSDSVAVAATPAALSDDRLLYTNRNILKAIIKQTAELKKGMKMLSYWKLSPNKV